MRKVKSIAKRIVNVIKVCNQDFIRLPINLYGSSFANYQSTQQTLPLTFFLSSTRAINIHALSILFVANIVGFWFVILTKSIFKFFRQ